MGIWTKLKSTPLWLLLPAAAVAAVLGGTVAGYVPLVFDPSLYPAPQAQARELSTIDAEALEAANSEHVGDGIAASALQDGTYTGYAACGQGNAEGWQPYYVAVTIQVKDGKATITGIAGSSTGRDGMAALSWDAAENQAYLDRALSGGVQTQLQSQLDASGTVSGVDTVSGATYSSTAIYNALADALSQAGGASATALSAPASEQVDTSKTVSAGTASKAKLADGTWTGYAACGTGNDDGWSPYYIAVTVKVKNGKVVAVSGIAGSATGEKGAARLSWSASENQRYLNWAVRGRNADEGVKAQMDAQIAAKGSVSGIDTVSGATYSSEAIIEAYAAALSESAKAAGSDSGSKDAASKSKKKDKKKPAKKSPAKKVTTTAPLAGKLADGSWVGYAACGEGNADDWAPYYVAVTVKVSGGKAQSITAVEGSSKGDAGSAALAWSPDENQRYLDWASEGRVKSGTTYTGMTSQINAALAKGSAVGDLDAVSGATYSSKAIAAAYAAALKKSAAAAGSTYEDGAAVVEDDDDAGDSEGNSDGDGGRTDPAVPAADDEGGNDGPASDLVDGTYTGFGWCEDPEYIDEWNPYYVLATIEVKDGKVISFANVRGDSAGEVDSAFPFESENSFYLNRAINGTSRMVGIVSQIQAKLDAGSAVSGIDTVSGATFSSRAIIAAYESAAAQAVAVSTSS